MDSDTKLTAKDATDAKTPQIRPPPRPESNGRRPGPGFGPKSGKLSSKFILLTRARPGIDIRYTYGIPISNLREALPENGWGNACSSGWVVTPSLEKMCFLVQKVGQITFPNDEQTQHMGVAR